MGQADLGMGQTDTHLKMKGIEFVFNSLKPTCYTTLMSGLLHTLKIQQREMRRSFRHSLNLGFKKIT